MHHIRASEQPPTLRVEDQVVRDSHLVALLLLKSFEELLPVKANLHYNLHEHVLVDGADLGHDLIRCDREVKRQGLDKPAVPPDLWDGDALQRVHNEHSRDEILNVVRHVAGQSEDATLDLLEQVGDVLVVKGERAAEQGVKDDPARPDVHLGTRVELARDDLRRRIVWRATRRLKKVAVLHHVGQAKVSDAQLLLRVEQQILGLKIAVDHRVLVAILHARDELLEHGACPRLR
mmetsp:Transcript_8808/g.28374  ORF Transcript_8808/g.28374 Transcript_8808/m.28374 type:complete len:234 (-) Transcript_8808:396-1097(-)